MTAPANAGTVALIAHGIMQRRLETGQIDAGDFSPLKRYASNGSRLDHTIREACLEAWKIVTIAEELRPTD